jgi:proteic killer suppression protein
VLDAYGKAVHTERVRKGDVQLVRFRHKGLRQFHEEGNAKGVPSSMADKLRKLLFALETAGTLEQLRRFPGWKLHLL